MTTLTIYRPPSTAIVTINIDEKTIYSKKLMGEHAIKCEVYYGSVLSLQIGDFITYNSENYYINRLPSIEKINNVSFKHVIIFESVLYNLSRKLFISSDGLADYSYNGSATDFITNIVASINEIDAGWTVGTVDASDDLTLQFLNESCRAALTKVAEAFDMEFELTGRAISLLNSAGSGTSYSFQYGRDLGLYKIERVQVQDQNILTKVYGFGGTTNIPSDYRSRAKRLTFAASGMAASGCLISAASGLYGIIEGQFTDDEIYPKRTSTLTDVNMVFDSGASGFNNRTSYIEDSTIDFDINDYLIEELTAKIVFKSGDLSGIQCEIWKYDATNKRIYINPYTDVDGYTLPFYNGGSPVIPSIGDSYTLVDMKMPTAYVVAAETDLQAATQAFLDENCTPMVVYSIDIDPKYAAGISLNLDVGDKVTIVDSNLGINTLIRVSSIEFPLVNPHQIKAVIADFVPYTLQERIVKAAITNKKNILTVDKNAEELARLNALRLHRELAKKTIPMYQGLYVAGTTYYGNPSRLDIVKYNPGSGEVFYIARPDAPSESFSGIVPTNTDYWERFEAEYNSIATNLLFAEIAYIDNLGVKLFNGVPVPVGDLHGSVVNTQANVPAIARVDKIVLTGTGGDADITCEAVTRHLNYTLSLGDTALSFVNDYAADYAASGVNVTNIGDTIYFTAVTPGIDFHHNDTEIVNSTPDLDGVASTVTANQVAVKRIDTVTLDGVSGTANILCDGVTSLATFINSLTETAAAFADSFAADYLVGGVVLTSSGADVIFTAEVAGVDFTGSTTIANEENHYRGGIRIEGNEVWENEEDNDTYGSIAINRKGYEGGATRFRAFCIFNGKGIPIMSFLGAADKNIIYCWAKHFYFLNLPTSDSGLNAGEVYRDGAFLKIKV